MQKLNNRRVIVTGAGSGVGAATVIAAANHGAFVTALDINEAALSQPIDTVSSQKLDVSNETDWETFADSLAPASIDHLHLNAGIQSAPPEAPLENYAFKNLSVPHYRKMMGVNVDGVVLGLHYLLPKMKPGGSIVVTCSLAGIVPYDIDPLYSMSKHAVTGLVRSLKRELAEQDLRINALCPGGIDTEIIPHAQRTDAAEFMTPEAIADEIINLFLTEESGSTWAKVSETKAAWIIHPPGKR
ncbi:MAG: NAD(P)-dependent dehydrogenase (short-subunit alcohol dehydrogenase family) [Candidatus Azotimanducaceae bacterium]|jgi:NAD(P)-dependent dehydrogenase (short-subunit alcohol dehydrogenase family)